MLAPESVRGRGKTESGTAFASDGIVGRRCTVRLETTTATAFSCPAIERKVRKKRKKRWARDSPPERS